MADAVHTTLMIVLMAFLILVLIYCGFMAFMDMRDTWKRRK